MSEEEESKCWWHSVSDEDGEGDGDGITLLKSSAPNGSAKYNTGFTSGIFGFTSAHLFIQ